MRGGAWQQALGLMEAMEKLRVTPDAITCALDGSMFGSARFFFGPVDVRDFFGGRGRRFCLKSHGSKTKRRELWP